MRDELRLLMSPRMVEYARDTMPDPKSFIPSATKGVLTDKDLHQRFFEGRVGEVALMVALKGYGISYTDTAARREHADVWLDDFSVGVDAKAVRLTPGKRSDFLIPRGQWEDLAHYTVQIPLEDTPDPLVPMTATLRLVATRREWQQAREFDYGHGATMILPEGSVRRAVPWLRALQERSR